MEKIVNIIKNLKKYFFLSMVAMQNWKDVNIGIPNVWFVGCTYKTNLKSSINNSKAASLSREQ